MQRIIQKLSYSILANIISVVISIMMILVLPKSMSLEDYGIWQLFLFYFSYVGFFHFGWIDGIYLRYGGVYYSDLDRKVFSSQFFLFVVFLLVECLIVNTLLNIYYISDSITQYVVKIASFSGVFFCVTAFINFILQLSGRIEQYAINVVLERFLTLLFILGFVFLGLTNYRQIIYVKLITCILTAAYTVYVVRDLVLYKIDSIKVTINETCKNISVGSKLMLSNIAAMLVLGIIRLGIARGWDVVTFGKVSLTLQISNFLMVFINAVSVVLFPFLKRIDQGKLTDVYLILRRTITYLLLGLLVTYYPLKTILELWLPKYQESLFFMGVLLPCCIFESKMQLLVNTYLKSLRQERLMLRINVISVIFALLTTYVTVFIMHNLNLSILSIVINFAFRLFIAEAFVEKLLNVNLVGERIFELCIVSLFIAINYNQIMHGPAIYVVLYSIYLYMNKDKLIQVLTIMKRI